jgi:hypothetical protein
MMAMMHWKDGQWDNTILNIFDFTGVNVLVIGGRHSIDDLEQLNALISLYPYMTVFVCGDEEHLFPYWKLEGIVKVWVQTPLPDLPSKYHALPNGPTPGTYTIAPKTLDWAFLGQVTTPIRRACYTALSALNTGYLYGSNGFTQGLEHQDYLDTLAKAKVAPCPGGPFTPDTFRLYEALELDCEPIVDASPYWSRLFPDFPFFQIEDWSTVGKLLVDVPYIPGLAKEWWTEQKERMKKQFKEDLIELQG